MASGAPQRPSGIASAQTWQGYFASTREGREITDLAQRVSGSVTLSPAPPMAPSPSLRPPRENMWNQLPSDMFIQIARFLLLPEALCLAAVSRSWAGSVASRRQAILHSHALDFDRTVDAKRACQLYKTKNIIGEAAWKRTGWNPGPIPPLSDETATHLESPCPFWPARGRIIDTHLLVWIPASVTKTIDGRLETVPVTLANLPNIIPGARYYFMLPQVLAQHGNDAPARGRWLLVPKEVIPGSAYRTFAQQQVLVAARGREMPHAVDIAVALFMKQCCSPGTHLLVLDLVRYTRCQETVQIEEGGAQYPLVVGGFCPAGLFVNHSGYFFFDSEYYGVAGPAEVQVLGT